MDRLYTRDEYMRRIDWLKSARRRYSITTDIIVGFPGETEEDFEADARPARRSRIRFAVQLQVFAAPEHGRARFWTTRSPKKRSSGGWRSCRRSSAPSRSGATPSSSAACGKCWWKAVTRRWDSGSAALRTTARSISPTRRTATATRWSGQYLPVRVTRSGPNSLVGESVTVV